MASVVREYAVFGVYAHVKVHVCPLSVAEDLVELCHYAVYSGDILEHHPPVQGPVVRNLVINKAFRFCF